MDFFNIHSYLPQHLDADGKLQKTKEQLYTLFMARIKKKSNDDYISKGSDPKQAILHVNGRKFDYQIAVIVKIGSFELIKSGDDSKVIGFKAIVMNGEGSEFELNVHEKEPGKMPKAYLNRIWSLRL